MAENHLPPPVSFGTRAVHAGQDPEKWTYWEAVPPISLSTTYKQPAPGEHKVCVCVCVCVCVFVCTCGLMHFQGFDYSRSGNPTRACLEEAFAAICNGKHGTSLCE